MRKMMAIAATTALFASPAIAQQQGGLVNVNVSDISVDLERVISDNNINAQTQATIHSIDQAYWLVVSLKQKDALASQYLQLTEKFSDDVKKMIREGVCTKADGLRVDVRVNEAEMACWASSCRRCQNGFPTRKLTGT